MRIQTSSGGVCTDCVGGESQNQTRDVLVVVVEEEGAAARSGGAGVAARSGVGGSGVAALLSRTNGSSCQSETQHGERLNVAINGS